MSAPRHAENAFGDDVALDERGAAGDRRTAGLVREPQPPPRDGGVPGLVVERELAAQRFEREAEVGEVLDQRAEVQLADRGHRTRRTGRVADHPLADRAVHQGTRPQVRDLLPDVRVRAERVAGRIGHAADVGDEIVDRLGGVHPSGGDGDTLERQGAHGNSPAAVHLSHDRVVGHEHVVEEDLVELRLAEQVRERPDRHTLAVHRQQEVRDALVPRPAAGAGEQDRVRRQLGAAGPDLLALDPPAALDLRGPGPQRCEVRARVGFGEQLAPDLLAGEDRTQVTPLLRLCAEVDDGRAGEVLADGVEPFRGSGQVALLAEDRPHPLVQALSAVLARPGEAGVPALVDHGLPRPPERQLLDQVRGLGPGQLRQVLVQPGAQLLAEPGLVRGVREIHQPSFDWMSARRTCFWILPVAVIGNAGTISSRSGSFWVASLCSRSSAVTSSSDSAGAASARTTYTQTFSPSRSSGMPTAATLATAGWPSRWSSISRALMFMPPRMMMSLSRPVTRTKPSASIRPRSPDREKPSGVNSAAVCSSSRKYSIMWLGPR